MAGVPPRSPFAAIAAAAGLARHTRPGSRVVRLGGDLVVGIAFRSNLDGHRGAGHAFDGRQRRPAQVTLMPACSRAELSTPGQGKAARHPAACAVFQGTKRVGAAGASEETNRCTPMPVSAACRLMQACASAWLAMSARRSGSTAGRIRAWSPPGSRAPRAASADAR